MRFWALGFAAAMSLGLSAVFVAAFGSSASATDIGGVDSETAFRNALATLNAPGPGPHTITITGDFTISGAVDPVYTGNRKLTIYGVGHTVSAANSGVRFLSIGAGATLVTIDGLTVAGIEHPLAGSTATGGAITASSRELRVTNCTFSNNSASAVVSGASSSGTSYGGAIAVTSAPITVLDSVFSNNGVSVNATGTAGSAYRPDVRRSDSSCVGRRHHQADRVLGQRRPDRSLRARAARRIRTERAWVAPSSSETGPSTFGSRP